MPSWTSFTHPNELSIGAMLLLTDGSVFCQVSGTQYWNRLTPDSHGSYGTGTWSSLAPAPTAPLYYASAVLKNGRVIVAGGEYADGLEWDLMAAQIYNPDSDCWTITSLPQGWKNFGDAPSCLLPDGRLLLGSINDNKTAIYDPTNNTWTSAASKNNANSDEETWTLLPDNTVVTLDCTGHPAAQKYLIAQDHWLALDTKQLQDLVEASSIEIGPAVLLPDGRLFAIGATGKTAFYKPGTNSTDIGTWSAAPSIPAVAGHAVLGAKDAPACLLPSGKVLLIVGPVDGQKDSYLTPMFFFLFDPVSNSYTQVPRPGGLPDNLAPYSAIFLLLPNGQVLLSVGTSTVYLFEPDGLPDPSWRPTITGVANWDGTQATSLSANKWFRLSGTQLNGLSQACSYGDDAQMATNYPLVRIQNLATNQIIYCKTQDHSTMGVATGAAVQNTTFLVPVSIGTGASQLFVVANGIESMAFPITVEAEMQEPRNGVVENVNLLFPNDARNERDD